MLLNVAAQGVNGSCGVIDGVLKPQPNVKFKLLASIFLPVSERLTVVLGKTTEQPHQTS
jgi:hypothetical protein